MIKINGWHRLWLVLVLAYMVGLGFITYIRQPQAEDVKFEDVLHFMSTPTLTLVTDAANDIEWSEVIEGGIKIAIPPKLATPLAQSYKSEYIQSHGLALHAKRILFIEKMILWWLVPSALLLIFGYLANWVRRGFIAKAA